jgi:DNA-binding MarR family transcriptional regulator
MIVGCANVLRMDEGDAPQRLHALPSWLLARTALLGARTVTAHLDEAGMRRAHYALHVALREDGPASQAALGRRLAADRSDMHRTVGELESRALIAREPDPDDRRRNLVTLTGAGVTALGEADALVDAAQAELLAPLSATECDELVRLLGRILARGW